MQNKIKEISEQTVKRLTVTIKHVQTIKGTINKASGTAQSDHIITTANAAGNVIETVPEIVTYTIEEET